MSLYRSAADIAAIRYKAHRGSVFEDTGETVCEVGPLHHELWSFVPLSTFDLPG